MLIFSSSRPVAYDHNKYTNVYDDMCLKHNDAYLKLIFNEKQGRKLKSY